MSDRPPERPPPVYSADPDDPFQSVQPTDPNLSFTAPPNPANMQLPEGASANSTWHVITGGLAVGMSNSWPITRVLTRGISGQTHVAYPSWNEAFMAYTQAFHANAVEVLRERTRRSLRRDVTPQPTPGGSASNPYVVTSSAPATPHRPSAQNTPTPGATRSHPYVVPSSQGTPFPSGHPQHPFYIGSSPAPVSPAPMSQGATPSKPSKTSGSNTRLRLIEEALLKASPQTPPQALSKASPQLPRPALNLHASMRDAARSMRNAARARLRSIEEALDEFEARQGTVPSPQTPTQENSTVEARLTALEAAMNLILAREAERESMQAAQRGDGHDPGVCVQDGRDPSVSVQDGRDPSPPRSAPPSTPIAGSSTGPGTVAGAAVPSDARPSVLRSPIALATLCRCEDDDDDDDDDDEYTFDEFTPEESAELDELLNAIHENFYANKQK